MALHYHPPAAGGAAIGNTTIVQVLNNGANAINHALGVEALDVVVLNPAKQKVDVNWTNTDANNIDITLPGGGPLNATIHITTP